MGLRRASHVAWRRIGDETILIHLKTKCLFVLNPSGGFFWHRLDGARGTAEILDSTAIAELPASAVDELDRFWEKLADAELIETGVPSDSTANGDDRAYPLSSFVPPELIWQEELRNFGQSCANMSADGPVCDAAPSI